MCQSRDIGLDSLYCGKWRNAQCRTHPSNFHIIQYVQVSSGLNHYFLSYLYTDRQTDRHQDRHTDRHTDGDEYSIVVVDKP